MKLLDPAQMVIATSVCTAAGQKTSKNARQQLHHSSFLQPPPELRPRFRYVVPEASVNVSALENDIAEVAMAGAGGIELLGYPGGVIPEIDWTLYSWGGSAWNSLTTAALEATKKFGLLLDFAIGPFQGAGVPAMYGDPGIMWDLLAFNESVPLGGSYNAKLPGWGSGRLVSASIGLVTSSKPVNLTAANGYGASVKYNGTSYTLDHSTLEEVTDRVRSNGSISMTFPGHLAGEAYHLFAFYEVQVDHRELDIPTRLGASVPQSPVTSFIENGSFIVDHFSDAGAQLIIEFWEHTLLDEHTRELLEDVGNYAWEDSYEFGLAAHIWYTPQLLEEFSSYHGYSLNSYLPLLYSSNTQFNGPLASINRYFTNEDDLGFGYVQDYKRTMTELNGRYLRKLTEWAHALGVEFSAQVLYNLPLDVLANVPIVDAPECESLGFRNNIDLYRQYASPAILAGKRIISNELGAEASKAYSQTIPDLVWSMKRSIAGSVNNFILHIYPFSGNYYNTTWPGYTTFTYLFSGMHGPRQPGWEFFNDVSGWIARSQFAAQQGLPKVDLIFWLNQQAGMSQDDGYTWNDLEEAGFTYGYISPANLDLSSAEVTKNIFAPEAQSAKALIIRQNDTLTFNGVQKIVQYAEAGLPIVFHGQLPSKFEGNVPSHLRSSAIKSLSALLEHSNVYQIPAAPIAERLQDLGIRPRTMVSATKTLFTHWREDKIENITYISVYNDASDDVLGAGHVQGGIEFETTGTPFIYDAWTGEMSALSCYVENNLTTTIPLSLRGNESTIVVFHHSSLANAARSAPFTDLQGCLYDTADGLQLPLSDQLRNNLELDDVTQYRLLPESDHIRLNEWSLRVEAWLPPDDIMSHISAKSNSTYQLKELLPWRQIGPELRNVSGRGHYSTSFEWPMSNAGGAVLDLGALLDVSRAWMNGHQLPALDPARPVAHLTPYLFNGSNTIDVVVSTTLANSMRPIWGQVMSGNVGSYGPVPIDQDYGLVLPVFIRPYKFIQGGRQSTQSNH